MTFLETPRFPDRISAGMESGPSWNTQVVIIRSGYEQRNQEWSASRMRFNIGTAITSPEELAEVISWMRALRGQAHGFRIKDWTDYSTTVSDDNGYVNTDGLGSGASTGQLYKYYAVGALSESRIINKPVTGTVTVYMDGVSISVSVDTTTGIVTYSAALDSASVTAATPASGDATTLTINDSLSGLQVGDKVYISGITGSIGNTLNGSAHTVQGISGSPETVLDLAVDTTGLSYSSGGTAALYPQARHSLRWAGEFDVPVRFGTDVMNMLVKNTRFQRWNDIPILEIRV
jgi:uncharacterized protein (TIGR02217 family)